MINIYLNNRRCEITPEVIAQISDGRMTSPVYRPNPSAMATSQGTPGVMYRPSKFYQYSTKTCNCINGAQFRIFFYEWGDLGRTPLHFDDKPSFKDFMTRSNLEFATVLDNSRFNLCTYMLYVVCLPNSSKMICHYSFNALVNYWEEANAAMGNPPSAKEYKTRMEAILDRDEIQVMFYNNSNIYSTPTLYNSWKKLKEFCDKYNLVISFHNEKRLKALNGKLHYGSCLPGFNVTCFRDSHDKLKACMNLCDVASER